MKIHIISDSLKLNSGYSKVAKGLVHGLIRSGHEISYTGLQTSYTPEYYDSLEILPVMTNFLQENEQILINIKTANPDIIICIFQSDDPSLNYIPKLFSRTIWYTTIEGARVPKYTMKDFKQVLDNGGTIVVPTMFGKREIEKELEIEKDKLQLNKEKIIYIPYGYDDKIYRPLDFKNNNNLNEKGSFLRKIKINGGKDQEQWQMREIDIKNEFKGKFVFGCICQNFGVRKRLERLLKAYSIFLDDIGGRQIRDRTELHLHTMPVSSKGLDLIDECERLGIDKSVSFSFGDYRSSGWSENGIAVLMNKFDCHVMSSGGEGFNLPTLECMASGIPCIGPDFTSFPELIGNINGNNEKNKERGLLAKLDTIQMTETTSYKGLVNEGIGSVDDGLGLAGCMKLMYNREDLRKKWRLNGIEFAKNFRWEEVIKKWNAIIQ